MTQRTRAPGPGALSALGRTVSELWADPSPRPVPPRRQRAAPGVAGLVAVPRAATARLLVPTRPARAAAGAVSRYSSALSRRERATRAALAAGLRLGGARVLPDGIEVREGGLVAHLGDVLGEPVVVSVGIGTERANRKPVLEVFDRRGRSLAFVKVGDTAVARAHVEGEERALAHVQDVDWATVRTPRVLHADDWEGRRVLVISALATTPWARRRPDLVHAAQEEVFAAADRERVAWHLAPCWTEATRTASTVGADEGERLGAALAALEDRLPDRDVTVGSWHGDWTPWNMCPVRRRLHVWDWERFATGVPVGMDAAHLAVNVATRSLGTTHDVVARALTGSTTDELVRATYLASVTARYLAAAADEGGAAIRPRALVFLDALEREAGTEPEHPSSRHVRRQPA